MIPFIKNASTPAYPIVLTIAGTDPSGGAGIQADIKAISATGSYAASVITALLAQNTQGVQGIFAVSSDCVRQQLDSVFSDLEVKAVKIGMLHDGAILEVVFSELSKLGQKHVVFDPVLVSKSGAILLQLSAIDSLKLHVKGTVQLLTPNLTEAEHLLDAAISTQSDMSAAAMQLGKRFDLSVLVKGGHLSDKDSPDVLYIKEEDQCQWFHAPRIITHNSHGTGCTLSSAIASYLAQGLSLHDAVAAAKSYLTLALQSASSNQIGKGNGPLNHFYFL